MYTSHLFHNKVYNWTSLLDITRILSFGIILLVFLFVIPLEAEEECLNTRLWCYECNSWKDSRCKDPFNESSSLQEPALLKRCEGCCVKIVTDKGTQKRGKRYTAAESIQKWVRGHKILIRLHKKNVSATQIEIWWRRIMKKHNLSKISSNKNDKNQSFFFPSSSSLMNGIENLKKLLITYVIADWWKTSVPDPLCSDGVDMLCTDVTGDDLKEKNADLEISEYQQKSKTKVNSLSNYIESIRNESFMEGDLEIQQIPLKKCSPMFSLFEENMNDDKNKEANEIWELSQHELYVMQDFRINSISESSENEIKVDILPGIEKKCENFLNLHIEDNEMRIKSIYNDNPFAEEALMECIENEKEMEIKSIYSDNPFVEEISVEYIENEKNLACTKIQKQWKRMQIRQIYQKILKSILIIQTVNRGFLMRKKCLSLFMLLKKKNNYCRKLQIWWKNIADRKCSAKITLVQAFGKGYIQRKFWKIKLLLQREIYINNLKERYNKEKANIVTIQMFIRCYLTWFQLKGNIMEMSNIFLSMMDENIEHCFAEIEKKKR